MYERAFSSGLCLASLRLVRRVLQNSWRINIEAFTTTSLSASIRTRAYAYAACAYAGFTDGNVERRMRCIAAFHARLRSIRSLTDHYGYIAGTKNCIILFLLGFGYVEKTGMIFLKPQVIHQNGNSLNLPHTNNSISSLSGSYFLLIEKIHSIFVTGNEESFSLKVVPHVLSNKLFDKIIHDSTVR